MSGIPTVYRGIVFRSRIEARWAAMFDELDWGWEYEPFDLDGYIPDFVLNFDRLTLVEVKSELRLIDLLPASRKIDRSGWDGDAVIVGATPVFREPPVASAEVGIGFLRGGDEEPWSPGSWAVCRECDRMTFLLPSGSWACRRCGAYDGDRHLHRGYDPGEMEKAIRGDWASAHNQTAWRSVAA